MKRTPRRLEARNGSQGPSETGVRGRAPTVRSPTGSTAVAATTAATTVTATAAVTTTAATVATTATAVATTTAATEAAATTTAATAATARSAAATTTAAFATLVCGVHTQRTAVEHLAVHAICGDARFTLGCVFDESKAARAACFPVDHDRCRDHLPMGAERVLELLIHGAVGEVANVETSTHGPSSFSAPRKLTLERTLGAGVRFNDSPPRCDRGRRQHTTQHGSED
jgi:hypothetical protein